MHHLMNFILSLVLTLTLTHPILPASQPPGPQPDQPTDIQSRLVVFEIFLRST